MRQVYWLRREDIAFFEEGVQLVQERRRAADTVEVHSKGGEGDHGRIGAFMVRTKGPKGGGRRSFVGGAVRVLRDQYTEGEERSFGGLQERGRVEGVDEREIDILPQEWAGEGEGDVEIAKGRSSGGTDTGELRAELWEDRGSTEAGGDGRFTMGDSDRREMGVAGVYGIGQVEYGGSILVFQGAGEKDRRAE